MRLLMVFIMAVVGGFAGHCIRPVIDKYFVNETGRLACYGVGVLLFQPFAMLVRRQVKTENEDERLLVSNVLAAVFVGIGVIAGYIKDNIIKESE